MINKFESLLIRGIILMGFITIILGCFTLAGAVL